MLWARGSYESVSAEMCIYSCLRTRAATPVRSRNDLKPVGKTHGVKLTIPPTRRPPSSSKPRSSPRALTFVRKPTRPPAAHTWGRQRVRTKSDFYALLNSKGLTAYVCPKSIIPPMRISLRSMASSSSSSSLTCESVGRRPYASRCPCSCGSSSSSGSRTEATGSCSERRFDLDFGYLKSRQGRLTGVYAR